MLRRLIIVVALMSNSSVILAADAAASASEVQSQAAKTQVQGQTPASSPSDQTAPTKPTKSAKTNKSAKTAQATQPEYQFLTGAYLGLSLAPQNTYSGAPAVNKAFAVFLSAGAATMVTEKGYFAGEIFVDNNFDIKNFKNGRANLRSNWTYGFDAIPGYLITKYILAYLRLGISNTRFTRPNSGVAAWRLGVGAETNLKDRWDLRGEYVYNNFKRVSIGKPQKDQFILGIIYKFV